MWQAGVLLLLICAATQVFGDNVVQGESLWDKLGFLFEQGKTLSGGGLVSALFALPLTSLLGLSLIHIYHGFIIHDAVPDTRKLHLIPKAYLVIIGLIFEGQRQDAGIDEVGPVDTGKALGDDGFDSQIERNESGMLTGRTLAIVLTTDNDALPSLSGALGELLVADGEAEVGQIGDVGTVGQDFGSCRHNVVGSCLLYTSTFVMIIILKEKAAPQKVQQLIQDMEAQGLSIHQSQGVNTTLLGIVGDTSKVDIEKIQALDVVAQVKRIQEPYKSANRKFHPQDTVIDIRGKKIGGGHFQVAAGPCSVESREQLMTIADQVKDAGAGILRGGAFKPRTSPYAFQGLGAQGIELLKRCV